MAHGEAGHRFRKGVHHNEKGGSMAKTAEPHATDISIRPEPVWQPSWFSVGTVKFAAFGDRLLVSEDEFKSGYECRTCNGVGRITCDQCGGQGEYGRGGTQFKCSFCGGGGQLKCSACGGKGGLLVVPDIAQRRPSTGQVV